MAKYLCTEESSLGEVFGRKGEVYDSLDDSFPVHGLLFLRIGEKSIYVQRSRFRLFIVSQIEDEADNMEYGGFPSMEDLRIGYYQQQVNNIRLANECGELREVVIRMAELLQELEQRMVLPDRPDGAAELRKTYACEICNTDPCRFCDLSGEPNPEAFTRDELVHALRLAYIGEDGMLAPTSAQPQSVYHLSGKQRYGEFTRDDLLQALVVGAAPQPEVM